MGKLKLTSKEKSKNSSSDMSIKHSSKRKWKKIAIVLAITQVISILYLILTT